MEHVPDLGKFGRAVRVFDGDLGLQRIELFDARIEFAGNILLGDQLAVVDMSGYLGLVSGKSQPFRRLAPGAKVPSEPLETGVEFRIHRLTRSDRSETDLTTAARSCRRGSTG